ncbi:MAG TPA: hypothetical protein VJP76_00515 [Candidatus Tumulicola sp.]|nr:hypothetical protein [Candidatus Tumulicola sp.]
MRNQIIAAAAVAAVIAAPAAAAPSLTFAYSSTATVPGGETKSVSCTIALAPAKDGNVNVTLTMPGKPAVTIKLPAGGTGAMPEPAGGDSQQQAQVRLILERVAIVAQIRKAKAAGGAAAVKIPVLPPGASQPLQLPATLAAQGATLTGSASAQTSAEVDTQKAAIHGIMPIRRVAQRLKNAATPKTVTVPDSVAATVTAHLNGATLSGLSGNVTHTLSGNGKSVVIPENWTLTKM